MKRLCIFVIYDQERLLREETAYLLEKLGEVSDTVIAAVNGGLRTECMPRLRSLSSSVIVRENRGFDAGAYKDALLPLFESGELSGYDELVLCNDTFFGPFDPFGDVFGTMDGISCEFWGMTRYLAQPEQNIAEHIQAYFLVFRRRVLSDASFRAFWESLIYPRDYDEAVLRFEIALSQTLFFCGFTGATYAEACGWQFHEDGNDYVRYPLELIRDARLPLLKKRVLKDDVSDVTTLAPVMRHIKESTGYPVDWIYGHWLRLYGDRPAGRCVPAGLPYFTAADLEEFCGKYRRVFVYGRGKVASYVREYLDFRGITVEAFLVSERGASCPSDEAVFTDTVAFGEAPLDGDCGIIVALGRKNFPEVYPMLVRRGLHHRLLLPRGILLPPGQ
ncbi:MAG: rhamnan synthesis F family protein [Treponema sp.]|nr:rhamnan synthesis F family protein [Treponema sp.]